MMKRTALKKMQLNKDTIRELRIEDLGYKQGGRPGQSRLTICATACFECLTAFECAAATSR
jgi:hypothetical protein